MSPSLNLDPWQLEFVNYKGDIALCSPRQHGKSFAAAAKAVEFALNNPKSHIMIVSVTEDQAMELLQKCIAYTEYECHSKIAKGKDRPTKSILTFTNKSVIRTKAVGQSGFSALGYTNHMLIVDEASLVPESIWESLTPTVLTTGGDIVLLSTPHGRRGYFFRAFTDPDMKFKTIRVKLGDLEKRPISNLWTEFRREKMLNHIQNERLRMSEREFKQQYLAEFVDDLGQFYPDKILKTTLIQQKVDYGKEGQSFYIGVDIGRMGGDKTVFEIFEKRGELLIQREQIIWDEAYLDRIALQIIEWDKTFNFERIYLDNGGIGIGVFDILYNTQGFKKRVKGINNAEKIVEYNPDGSERKSKWMKEEIYANLYFLLAKGKILLFDDGDIWLSLKSAEYEYINQRGGAMMKISHPDHRQSHICEAIVRAAMASKEKINNFRISYI